MTIQSLKLIKLNLQGILILIIFFLLPFYFIKFRYSWISLNLIELLIITLFLFWIFNRNKKYLILNTKYLIPISLVLLGVISSILANENYYVSLGILKGWFILPVIFALIFYDNLKKNEKLLGWSLQALFYSGILVAVEGSYYWMSGFLTYDGRLAIFYDSPNQLAMFLAPIFIISLFFFLKETERAKKIAFGGGLAIIMLNLYLTKSFGTWMAVSLALAVVFRLVYSKILKKRVSALLALLILAFLVGFGSGKLTNLKEEGLRSSLASRVMIWKSAALMLKNNPLLGIGPGNFQNKYLEYQKYFPPYLEWAVPQPHNLFLAFWLEAGSIGLVGFLLLLFQFFRDNKKAIENNHPFGSLCLVIMLYFLIHGLIDTTYWRNDMAIIFWAVIAINLFLVSKKTEALEC